MSLAAAKRRNVFQMLASSMDDVRARWRTSRAKDVPLREADDAALVAKHLAGDPHAFAELVKRYTSAVYNVTYRFTNNAAEAENLTQETFLRAWNALPRITTDRPLKPYILKIAVNLCHDWAEQNKVPSAALEEHEETLIADDAADPLQNVSDQELRERVRTKLELLSPMHRTVITMRYSEEMSYEEMATALSLPLNTVRTHLHRAKARLRELMEQDG
jgi:RNA polymerase sigma-70 factor, ECF subfamily